MTDATSTVSSSTTDYSDILIPTTITVQFDKVPTTWNGNDAAIDGVMYEVGKYYKRVGLFQAWFEHRAVALSNGKTAVESFPRNDWWSDLILVCRCRTMMRKSSTSSGSALYSSSVY